MVFFCLDSDPKLDLKKHFLNPDTLHLDPLFVYPVLIDEADHMDVFRDALVLHLPDKDVRVHQINNPGNTDHYCQFSGGGDLFITKKASSIVICHHDAVHSSQSHRSPIHEDEHMSGLTVVKKSDAIIDSLKYQLFANTVLNSVGNFIYRCKNEKYDEAFFQKVDKILGYGVAYTGMGQYGLYKLELQFGHAIKFVTKHKLRHYSQPTSAAFMDAALDYFLTP